MRAILLRTSATFLAPVILYFKTFTFSFMVNRWMCIDVCV